MTSTDRIRIALAAVACLGATRALAADPFGTWLTEDGRARVRTERCGSDPSRLCGYVVWGAKPNDETGRPKVDRYNPDPGKRTRLQIGHQMLMGLSLNADGRYEGQIYNADNGKSYDVTVWSDRPGVLTVKGCMLVFCASQSWPRVTDLAAGQLPGATDAPNGPHADAEWARSAATGSTTPRKARPGEGQTPAR